MGIGFASRAARDTTTAASSSGDAARPAAATTASGGFAGALATAGAQGFSFGGHRVALGAVTTATTEQRIAPPVGTKRTAYGTAVERWGERAERQTIAAQVALGCKCGCVDQHANMNDILEQRRQHAGMTGAERRETMRGMVQNLRDDSKRIGFALNWGTVNSGACVNGFALRHGFTPAWVYAVLRDMQVGARERARASARHGARAC